VNTLVIAILLAIYFVGVFFGYLWRYVALLAMKNPTAGTTNGVTFKENLRILLAASLWPVRWFGYYIQGLKNNRDGLKWYEARYEDCIYVWPLSFPVLLVVAIIIIIIGMYLK